MRLTRTFFSSQTLEVAEELIGATMVYRSSIMSRRMRIVEVEAYIGEDDPACHAAAGKTARTEIMYGEPGYAYVYLIYGMYHCLNVVTERAGIPAAVLIRAAEPSEGFDSDDPLLLSGPGKLAKSLSLDRSHTGLSLCSHDWHFIKRETEPRVEVSSRIGITRGTEKLWRFSDADSMSVSGKRRTETVRALRGNKKSEMGVVSKI